VDFLLLSSFYLLTWNFRVSFLTYEDSEPYRSSTQMSYRVKAGVSFVALGILEPQTAQSSGSETLNSLSGSSTGIFQAVISV
jgi:hypothetical protein